MTNRPRSPRTAPASCSRKRGRAGGICSSWARMATTCGDSRAGGAKDRGAVYSPNGSSIVFERYRTGVGFRVFEIAASGGAPSPLTSGPGDYSPPSISPDGSRILFARRTETGSVRSGSWTPTAAPTHADDAADADFRHAAHVPAGREPHSLQPPRQRAASRRVADRDGRIRSRPAPDHADLRLVPQRGLATDPATPSLSPVPPGWAAPRAAKTKRAAWPGSRVLPFAQAKVQSRRH